MQRLHRKRIVLGVGGGIAAYKSAELVRRLKDQGAEVRVVLTRGGREFITRKSRSSDCCNSQLCAGIREIKMVSLDKNVGDALLDYVPARLRARVGT